MSPPRVAFAAFARPERAEEGGRISCPSFRGFRVFGFGFGLADTCLLVFLVPCLVEEDDEEGVWVCVCVFLVCV